MAETAGVEWSGEVLLTTPRLLLRTFRLDDLPVYAALNADPEVTRYLGGPVSREESDAIAAWAQQVRVAEGIGLLAVERRVDGAFVGMCGLHHLHWYPDDIELGFRLAREYWDHGYATEAAGAWLEHGFSVLQLPRVISVTDVPTWPHRSDAEARHGARPRGRLEHDGDRFRAVVHAITAEQWRLGQGAPL